MKSDIKEAPEAPSSSSRAQLGVAAARRARRAEFGFVASPRMPPASVTTARGRRARGAFVGFAFVTPGADIDAVVARMGVRARRHGLAAPADAGMAQELQAAGARMTRRMIASAPVDDDRRASAWVIGPGYRVGVFMRRMRWSWAARAWIVLTQFAAPRLGAWE
jgi:hypothetical protein